MKLPCRAGRDAAGLAREEVERLRRVARVLALACSLDQRAALERARDAARSRHIGGLVEQVRAPDALITTHPACPTLSPSA
jgi:uncharacterized protein (DUF2384 family)